MTKYEVVRYSEPTIKEVFETIDEAIAELSNLILPLCSLEMFKIEGDEYTRLAGVDEGRVLKSVTKTINKKVFRWVGRYVG